MQFLDPYQSYQLCGNFQPDIPGNLRFPPKKMGKLQIYALNYTQLTDLCIFYQNFQTYGENVNYMQSLANLCRKKQFWLKKKSNILDICGNSVIFSDLCTQQL